MSQDSKFRGPTTDDPIGAASSISFNASGGTPSWRSGPSLSPTPPMAGGPTPSTPLPPPTDVLPRSLTERESELVRHLSRLQFFLATAPTRWMGSDETRPSSDSPFHPRPLSSPNPNLNRFLLPNGEYVACVFWNGLYHITGTDIVRALVFRFEAFSRPVRNIKKFEEGIFSDLRNLKPGVDACLEEPKSPFLDLLFRNGCIRTQKKQKVFYWFSVPHDRLFLDALERDLKREKMGLEPTTVVVGEPARSFRYDPRRSLFDQFAGKQPGLEDTMSRGTSSTPNLGHDYHHSPSRLIGHGKSVPRDDDRSQAFDSPTAVSHPDNHSPSANAHLYAEDDVRAGRPGTANSILFSRSLFEGSPAYKQRRKKSARGKKQRTQRSDTATSTYDTGDEESGSESDGNPRADFGPQNQLGSSFGRPRISNPYSDSLGSDDRTITPVPLAPSELARTAAVTAPPSLGVGAGGVMLDLPSDRGRSSLPSWTSLIADGSGSGQISGQLNPYHPFPVRADNQLSALPHPVAFPPPNTPPNQAKGFSCPLLSCGRLFKRLEHLKRHVRTHTQERPYECARCAKRFSRSDNLTQHIKTHEKADRGERMKTEASESLEDDMATFLEAEVDAMAAREREGVVHLADDGLEVLQQNSTNSSLGLSKPTLATAQAIATTTNLRQDLNCTTIPTSSLFQQEWNGMLPSFPAHPFGPKRHRSMTPNMPQNSLSFGGPRNTSIPISSLANYPRYHPYSDPRPHGFHRATSLDPATIQPRSSTLQSSMVGNRSPLDLPSVFVSTDAGRFSQQEDASHEGS